jgi:hypothetical protein
MDKSSLNSSEKKELRKEVREIKSELKASGSVIFCRSNNNHYSFIFYYYNKSPISLKEKK